MRTKWTDQFVNTAKSKGLEVKILNRVRGWIETIEINGKRCYCRSMTYNKNREEYFIGVDPKKLKENGKFVCFCGGSDSTLRDIFLIPWDLFFEAINKGKAINTYKPPKEYWQYKVHLRNRNQKWVLSVQGGSNPKLNVGKWRFDVEKAIRTLN